MRYSIIAQNEKVPNLFIFFTVIEPVIKEVKTKVTYEETQEVKEVATYEPTGDTKTVNYSVEDKQEFENKYISLLDTLTGNKLYLLRLKTMIWI